MISNRALIYLLRKENECYCIKMLCRFFKYSNEEKLLFQIKKIQSVFIPHVIQGKPRIGINFIFVYYFLDSKKMDKSSLPEEMCLASHFFNFIFVFWMAFSFAGFSIMVFLSKRHCSLRMTDRAYSESYELWTQAHLAKVHLQLVLLGVSGWLFRSGFLRTPAVWDRHLKVCQ